MKVKDMIEKLKEFDPELTVCLSDWQEGYCRPNEAEAEDISVSTEFCTTKDGTAVQSFLKIGGWHD